MITPQSANFQSLLTQRGGGRGLVVQAHIEGVSDVLCTEAPADAKTKTYSVEFDGSNDHIACGTSTALTQLVGAATPGDWTMLAWVKVDSLAAARMVFSAHNNPGPRGYRVFIQTSGKIGAAFTGGGTADFEGAAVSTGAWTFIAVSIGGNTKTVARAIINDTNLTDQYIAVSRATRNVWNAGQTFYIGIDGDGASLPLDGRVGYMAIFNRALTHNEMRRLKYRIIDKKWGNDDSTGLWDVCVAQWTCERGTGTTLTNTKSPGTHDGTLTNGPTWQSDPPFTITYRPVLSPETSTGQSVDPLATRTTIQTSTLLFLDTDEWFTTALSASGLNLALPGKRVDVFVGLHGLLELEYQPVFNGPILGFDFQGKAYTIRVGDVFADVKAKLALAKTNIVDALTDVATSVTLPVNTRVADKDAPATGYARIDDEIVRWTNDAGSSAAKFALTIVRGEVSPPAGAAAAHDAGATFSEVMFAQAAGTGRILVLELLLSGAGFEASDAYDGYSAITYTDATTRVVYARGCGMSPSDVSKADILAVTGLDQGHAVYVEGTETEIKDLLEREVLRLTACYFFAKSDGRLSVASHAIPTTPVHTIGPDQTIRASWSIEYSNIINFVEVEHGYNTSTHTLQYFETDAASGLKYGLRKLSVKTNSAGLGSVPPFAARILARFKDPYIVADVTCGLSEMFVEVGDCVLFTDMHLPNVTTGRWGVHEQKWQVVGRKLDLRAGTVTLRLADVSRA